MQEIHADLSIILTSVYLTAVLYFMLIKTSSTHKNINSPLDDNMSTYMIDANGTSATILNQRNLCLLSSLAGMIAGIIYQATWSKFYALMTLLLRLVMQAKKYEYLSLYLPH